MTALILPAESKQVRDLISQGDCLKLNLKHKKFFEVFLRSSSKLWVGSIDEKVCCIFGLVPATLISEQVYLWLHVTEEIKGHEFGFVRKSQMAVQEMLQHYPKIVGHCEVDNYRAKRWIEWLGGEFGTKKDGFIPFCILRKE